MLATGHPSNRPFKSQAMKRYDDISAGIAADRARMANKNDTDTAVFEQIIVLEEKARGAKVSLLFAEPSLPDYLWHGRKANADKAMVALFAAVDALTPDQAARFGAYRANH